MAITGRSLTKKTSLILAGLVVVASVSFSRAYSDLSGTALMVTLTVSGAISLCGLTILVLGTWHPPASEGGDGAAPAPGAPYAPPVGHPPVGGPFRLATFGPRVVAALIDSAVVLGPGLLGVVVLLVSTDPGDDTAEGFAAGLIAFLILASSFLFVLNRGLFQGERGQSVGKRALKLRLVRFADGEPVGVVAAMVRDVLHLIDALLFNMGFVWPLWDERRQTLADKMARTVVVTEA